MRKWWRSCTKIVHSKWSGRKQWRVLRLTMRGKSDKKIWVFNEIKCGGRNRTSSKNRPSAENSTRIFMQTDRRNKLHLHNTTWSPFPRAHFDTCNRKTQKRRSLGQLIRIFKYFTASPQHQNCQKHETQASNFLNVKIYLWKQNFRQVIHRM